LAGDSRPRVPSIVGRVVSSATQDGSTFDVTAIRHDAVDRGREAVVLARANPSFTFRELASGTWDLVVTADGRFASLPSVTVREGRTTNVDDLILAAGAVLDVPHALDPRSSLQLEEDDAPLLVRQGEVRLALVVLAPGETAHLVLPAGSATLEL